MALFQHGIHQRGFAMIDMCDDRNVPNIVSDHSARSSPASRNFYFLRTAVSLIQLSQKNEDAYESILHYDFTIIFVLFCSVNRKHYLTILGSQVASPGAKQRISISTAMTSA